MSCGYDGRNIMVRIDLVLYEVVGIGLYLIILLVFEGIMRYEEVIKGYIFWICCC